MKCTHAILLVGFLCTVLASDGAAPKLEPNAIISFEFPDLPETLLTKSSGDKQPARLSAELPENYSPEGPLGAKILQKPAMKRCRFLLLRGDAPEDEHPGVRESNDYFARALEHTAREFHLDFTSVVMRGAGHALPSKYEVLLGQWARRETLPALETK